MGTELTVASVARDLDIMRPEMAEVLAACGVPVARLVRTVLWSIDRTPKLLQTTRTSLLQAAMGAAVLGLECDGVSGQAWILPYGDRAQLVPGYMGYNTMAARGGWTIQGDTVGENDIFEHERIDGELRIRHRRKIGGDRGRTIAAYAIGRHLQMPHIGELLDIDEVMAIKAKSPGSKRSDSPWNDMTVGFHAMACKTAKRRLKRSLPMSGAVQYHWAGRMDEAFEEQGKPAIVVPEKGVLIDGEIAGEPTLDEVYPPVQQTADQTPTAEQLNVYPTKIGDFEITLRDGSVRNFDTYDQWHRAMIHALEIISGGTKGVVSGLQDFWRRNGSHVEVIMKDPALHHFAQIVARHYHHKIEQGQKKA